MMKKLLASKRNISILVVIGLLVSSISLSIFIEKNSQKRVHHHRQEDIKNQPREFDMKDDYTISDSFSTHLPLVVIDTNGESPKSGVAWDKEKGYFAPLDIDPYVDGNITIIDNEGSVNNIKDKPTNKSDILIRQRGNTSTTFPKKQYLIKTINKDGSKNKQDILGMGEEWEWVLNISYIDKTLLRNYMDLNIAGEIMPYTPDVRYCEVVMKDNDEYTYEGVYLMMENVKQGEDRVNISQYDNKFTKSSYLLRRDRFEEDAVLLDNYSTKNKLLVGYLEVKYPKKDEITEKTIEYITNDINKFEECIYSDNIDEFYKYRDYIDVESFIDYFIINEFFANYDSGYHSTYIYKENGSKISMGPVWDFDMCLDNDIKLQNKLKIDSTAMHDAPWFRQLLKDADFTKKVIDRYYYLRKGILSEENLIKYIDDTVSFLGPSIERDILRWKYEGEYNAEIEKMKLVIREHGKWLDENIDSLYQFAEFGENEINKSVLEKAEVFILGNDKKTIATSILSVIFISIFILSIILVQRD